jgi:hypothetical protein
VATAVTPRPSCSRWSAASTAARSSTPTSPPAAPGGNVAQEAYDDEPLRSATNDVFEEWRSTMRASLTAAGHPDAEAADLAELCIAGVEGVPELRRDLDHRLTHGVEP